MSGNDELVLCVCCQEPARREHLCPKCGHYVHVHSIECDPDYRGPVDDEEYGERLNGAPGPKIVGEILVPIIIGDPVGCNRDW